MLGKELSTHWDLKSLVLCGNVVTEAGKAAFASELRAAVPDVQLNL